MKNHYLTVFIFPKGNIFMTENVYFEGSNDETKLTKHFSTTYMDIACFTLSGMILESAEITQSERNSSICYC